MSEQVSTAAVGWGGEGGVGPTSGRESPAHIAASCSEQARAGMHLLFCVLCSVKAFWGQVEQWVQATGAYWVRKDSGSVRRSLKEERLGVGCRKLFSGLLEQGGLTPGPAPLPLRPWQLLPHLQRTSHLPCGPPWGQRQPCQPPWQHCPSGNSDIESARESAGICLCLPRG